MLSRYRDAFVLCMDGLQFSSQAVDIADQRPDITQMGIDSTSDSGWAPAMFNHRYTQPIFYQSDTPGKSGLGEISSTGRETQTLALSKRHQIFKPPEIH